MADLKDLLQQCRHIVSGDQKTEERLQTICTALRDNIGYYDWVGFYIASQNDMTLALGPYDGEPTVHTKIRYGEGICGQAAETKKTFIIQDVQGEDNYLACSLEVKAEIVIPVFGQSGFVGEIDIDSHTLSPFTHSDKGMLEELAKAVSPLVEEISQLLSRTP